MNSALLAIGVLLLTLGLFIYGRWRHDVVAVIALILSSVLGLVPTDAVFSGFSHPAVVTVACVLILSYALQQTGAIDVLAERVLPKKSNVTVSLLALTALAAFLSGFMNNVGALALLMPVSLQVAQRHNLPAGQILMPVSFATILGGMTTLIGTPSNLIVSGYRAEAIGQPFKMFDFTPLGVSLAIAGVLFISLIGWRLIPVRQRAHADAFETGSYLTEARVSEDSKAIGMRLSEVQEILATTDSQVLALIRENTTIQSPSPILQLQQNDILLIESDPDVLAKNLDVLNLVFHEDRILAMPTDEPEASPAPSSEPSEDTKSAEKKQPPVHTELSELVILPGSSLIGRTASNLRLRALYHVNLLAISRQGTRSRTRLRNMPLRTGDVLLLQGPEDRISNFASNGGCAILAARALRVPDRRKMLLANGIMVLSVALAASGLLSAALSFMLGVLLLLLFNVIALRQIYNAVDWSVIVLLAALIPVAQALESTQAAAQIANLLLEYGAQGNAILALALIMVTTMLLSDLMNNAATATVMSPVALGTAQQLDVNPDTFLMAIVIGASCAFLTPIGHQNNTLILGPGGFRFNDYWRMGLPLDLLIVALTLPLVLYFWPL
ncbi:SLC13 family permease [Paenalcaligenes hominis]|uniref:Di/tricarboxylate transporter n=2 Tax=Paenalcaligenes hominis TaxID=643674 RepID=A0ABX0WQ86_9BURK|nr:SLC13 family permease [Paenalcaligenes hominis]NJB65134.1 di/tricarboxylate transporter [Paenalcaligenes hominis]GGE56342.1 SLC13 family permease [Paenalcaligenes hominis]